MLYFTILLALFAGIGDPFLGLTLKKPKENQCFWLRTLKNLRKINVFAFPEHLVTLGAPLGPPRPKKIYHKLPIHRPSGIYVNSVKPIKGRYVALRQFGAEVYRFLQGFAGSA